jgi:hypothetical protein
VRRRVRPQIRRGLPTAWPAPLQRARSHIAASDGEPGVPGLRLIVREDVAVLYVGQRFGDFVGMDGGNELGQLA